MDILDLKFDQKQSKADTRSSGLLQAETADTRIRPRLECFYACDSDDEVGKL